MSRFAKLLLILLLLPVCTAGAAAISLSGLDTATAGDSVTLTLTLSGDNLYGIFGKLTYNSSQVICTDIDPATGRDWTVETNGDCFIAYSSDLQLPVSDSIAVLTFTFQINRELSPGTSISVACEDLTVSDMISDTALDSVIFSFVITENGTDATATATTQMPSSEPTVPENTTDTTLDVPAAITQTPSVCPTIPETTTVATLDSGATEDVTSEKEVSASTEEQNASFAKGGESLRTYALFALACISLGIGVGILINQQFFHKE